MADNKYRGPINKSNSTITGKNTFSNTEIRHDGNDNVDITTNYDDNIKLTGTSSNSNTSLTSSGPSNGSGTGKTGKKGDVVDYWTKDLYKNRQKKFDKTLKGLEDQEKALKQEKLDLTREKNKILNDTSLSQEDKAKALDKIKARQTEIDTKEIPANLKERSKMLDSAANKYRIQRGELGLDGQVGYYKAKQYEAKSAEINARLASTTTNKKEAKTFSTLADKYQAKSEQGPGKMMSFRTKVRQQYYSKINPVKRSLRKATAPARNAINKAISPAKHKLRMASMKARKAIGNAAKHVGQAIAKIAAQIGTFLVSNPIGWIILALLIALLVEIMIIIRTSIIIPDSNAGTFEPTTEVERFSYANAQVKATATWANKMKKEFYKKYHVTLSNADVVSVLLNYSGEDDLNELIDAFDDSEITTEADYEQEFSKFLEEKWPYERYEDIAEIWLDKVHYDFYYLTRTYGTWRYTGYEGYRIEGGHNHETLEENLAKYQNTLWEYTQSATANGNFEIVSWTGTVEEKYQTETVWFEEEEQCKTVTDTKTLAEKQVCEMVSVRKSRWDDHYRDVDATFYAFREITMETWVSDINNTNIDWNADRSLGAPASVNRRNAQVLKAPDPPSYPNGYPYTNPDFPGNKGDHDQYWIKIELINSNGKVGFRKRHRSWETKETIVMDYDDENPEDIERLNNSAYHVLTYELVPDSKDDTTETVYKEDKFCEGSLCNGQTVGIEYNKENIYEVLFNEDLLPLTDDEKEHLYVRVRDYRDLYKEVSASAIGLDNLDDFFPDFTLIEHWRNTWDPIKGENTYRYYGQCTWFAQGVFRQIYSDIIPELSGIMPGFTGNGIDVVSNFTQNNPYFTQQDEPAPGAIVSMSSTMFPMYGHVGIVLSVDGEMIHYIDGNYNGTTDPWEVAIHDWGYSTKTKSQLESLGATYAVYNGGTAE